MPYNMLLVCYPFPSLILFQADCTNSNVPLPFPSAVYKISGYGRESGLQRVYEYLNVKAL